MRRKILIIRFGSIGDIVLTSATVRNLKINFPDCEITFLTKASYATLAGLLGGVDEIVTLSNSASIGEWHHLIDTLDSRRFDVIVDLQGKVNSWLVRSLTTANDRLTYPKRRWERFWLTRTHRLPTEWPHTVDLYNSVVPQLGGEVYCRRPIVLRDSLPRIDSLWPDGEPALMIAPGAAHATKQWPVERFAQVAIDICNQRRFHIVWVSEAEERLPEILSTISSDRFHRAVNWPLDKLAALLARGTITLSNDSGIMHLSSAVGTPVAAVFGPTHPALGFAPRDVFDQVIQVEESCRPCSLHGQKPCFRKERFCFTRISPTHVVAELLTMADRRLNASPALFVDRDGTVLVNKHYLGDPDQVQFETGALDGLKLAAKSGFKIVIVSNQSGVARGLLTEDQVRSVNARMNDLLAAEGIRVAGHYYCPHHTREAVIARYRIACDCRKPATGMIEQAARELNLDIRRSVVIGDSLVDINLALAAGARPVLVRTGYGRETESRIGALSHGQGLLVADNLAAAVEQLAKD